MPNVFETIYILTFMFTCIKLPYNGALKDSDIIGQYFKLEVRKLEQIMKNVPANSINYILQT
jgi:hypothetical protein